MDNNPIYREIPQIAASNTMDIICISNQGADIMWEFDLQLDLEVKKIWQLDNSSQNKHK